MPTYSLRLSSLGILIFLSSLVYANSDQQAYRETRLGGFDFSKELITNKVLVGLFGKGCVDKDYPYHYRRMYYFHDEDVYAAFNIETDDLVVGLELTREPIASKKCRPKKKLSNFQTGRKIALGNRKEQVMSAYGEPWKEVQTNKVVIYRYYVGREEGPYMEIKFIEGRVVSVWITVGD